MLLIVSIMKCSNIKNYSNKFSILEIIFYFIFTIIYILKNYSIINILVFLINFILYLSNFFFIDNF